MNTKIIEMYAEGIEVNESKEMAVEAFKILSDLELVMVGGGSGDVGFA